MTRQCMLLLLSVLLLCQNVMGTASPTVMVAPTRLPTPEPTDAPVPPTSRRPTIAPTKQPTRNPDILAGCPDNQLDTDNDGTTDCVDECPHDFTKAAAGLCGCGVPDVLRDELGTGYPQCPDGSEPKYPGLSTGQFFRFESNESGASIISLNVLLSVLLAVLSMHLLA